MSHFAIGVGSVFLMSHLSACHFSIQPAFRRAAETNQSDVKITVAELMLMIGGEIRGALFELDRMNDQICFSL